jgi:phosphoenolpyruvate carboxylase
MNARIANQQKNWRGVIRIGENSVARKRITAERKKASKATYMRKYRKIKRAYVEKVRTATEPLPATRRRCQAVARLGQRRVGGRAQVS